MPSNHLILCHPLLLPPSLVAQMVKTACNTGDPGLIPGSGSASGEGNGNPLQYSCPQNSLDRGAWQAKVHGVTKEWDTAEQLKISITFCTKTLYWIKVYISLTSSPHEVPKFATALKVEK